MTSRVVAVGAPPRVRDWLAAAPDGDVRIVHRGRHAAYVDVAGRCLGVVGTAAAALPCALRLAAPDLGQLEARSARVEEGVLHLDGFALRVGRLVRTLVPRLVLAPARGDQSAEGLSFTAGRSPEVLVAEIGQGPGLTPQADDVLVGWLAVHRAAGLATPEVDAAVTSALDRTTLLSATLLQCALHGEVLPELAAWVAAVGGPDEVHAAAALARVGHTSGAAMLRGARLGLAHCSEIAERAA